MEIIKGTTHFKIEKKTAVAIGKFDGIHIGHRKLLSEILEKKKEGLLSCVFTFDPTPAAFFASLRGVDTACLELTTREAKRAIFEAMGVDILVEFPMNLETAATPPEEFISRYLVEQMSTAYICAGSDLSFGDKGAGNAKLLEQMSEAYGYKVSTIDKVCVSFDENEETEVSSSLTRDMVIKGDMKKVTLLLGKPYCVSGEVVHGNHVGHSLGFPTINVVPPANKLLPPFGVYTSKVRVNGKTYSAVSNVGCKPTVEQNGGALVETYLYDFDGDLYGSIAEVDLLEFRRPEQKFPSLEALKLQLQQDIIDSKPY